MSRPVWTILMCFLLGCSNAGSNSEVLPTDRMSKVLWDMIQVDELATLRLVKDTSKNIKTERIQLYEKVFQLNKTSKEQFSKSFSYYSSHPDILKILFDTLEARGTRERTMSYTTAKDSVAK